MIATFGRFFAERFRRWIPDSFIFAIMLTLIAAAMALLFVGAKPFGIVQAWYKGFWVLLAFAMQMVLILVTGFAIAISPPAEKFLDWLSKKVKTPVAVYGVVTFAGLIFSMISWGWIVLTAVLAREMAKRVKGVDYCLLAACVYSSNLGWHGGLSGSIPLVLNTPNNFLIQAKVLETTIPTTMTLLNPMNIGVCVGLLIVLPVLMILMRPADNQVTEFADMVDEEHKAIRPMTVEEEANTLKLPDKNLSDALNSSIILQFIIVIAGLWFLVHHFATKGFDINLNIMNFLFIILGMLAHKTPLRYLVAMKRSCSNISGIVLQFPFYAGIMGIMIHTGLGKAIAVWIAGFATVSTYPFIAFIIGGVVNIWVPSGGGEWAVIGQPILEAAKTLGASLPKEQLTELFARSSMAVAYGDAWTNMIQPFWTLAFLPVMAAGTKMQARDIMGYTFVSMIVSFFIYAICVTWLPI
ncbi:MAG: TIGR00366 family protein [Deltaproteobacteria bacterium]|nr:TIGR00366 family protein [Deltaproteobacteria bacterium]